MAAALAAAAGTVKWRVFYQAEGGGQTGTVTGRGRVEIRRMGNRGQEGPTLNAH